VGEHAGLPAGAAATMALELLYASASFNDRCLDTVSRSACEKGSAFCSPAQREPDSEHDAGTRRASQ